MALFFFSRSYFVFEFVSVCVYVWLYTVLLHIRYFMFVKIGCWRMNWRSVNQNKFLFLFFFLFLSTVFFCFHCTCDFICLFVSLFSKAVNVCTRILLLFIFGLIVIVIRSYYILSLFCVSFFTFFFILHRQFYTFSSEKIHSKWNDIWYAKTISIKTKSNVERWWWQWYSIHKHLFAAYSFLFW